MQQGSAHHSPPRSVSNPHCPARPAYNIMHGRCNVCKPVQNLMVSSYLSGRLNGTFLRTPLCQLWFANRRWSYRATGTLANVYAGLFHYNALLWLAPPNSSTTTSTVGRYGTCQQRIIDLPPSAFGKGTCEPKNRNRIRGGVQPRSGTDLHEIRQLAMPIVTHLFHVYRAPPLFFG